MSKYTWWELMQIQKYPDVPAKQAIEMGRESMRQRAIGNRGNPNPHLKGNPELARQIRQGKKTKEE